MVIGESCWRSLSINVGKNTCRSYKWDKKEKRTYKFDRDSIGVWIGRGKGNNPACDLRCKIGVMIRKILNIV